jgi:hypothetical protein
MREYLPFRALLGQTFTSVVTEDDKIIFTHNDGRVFTLEHEQDCCECVYIESIVGDLSDLENSEILRADEETLDGDDEETLDDDDEDEGIAMWTFYKLATRKGYVDIRFHGSSNGYYAVEVSLYVDVPEDIL